MAAFCNTLRGKSLKHRFPPECQRLIPYPHRETRSWDVRTKKVTWDTIPTPDGVTAIANYGPTAALFTLSRNHFVQQYDVAPSSVPLQVASAQHVPANTPPTPPTTLEEAHNPYSDSNTDVSRETTPALPAGITDTDTSSADEGALSPLQKIALEMDTLDALQSELRDKVMPLSPDSSRASSQASRSSGGRRRARRYLYDRPERSSRGSSTTGADGTEFSMSESPAKHGRDSMSIRSASSFATGPPHRTSNLRKQVMRSPTEAKETDGADLFPYTRARLRDVPFRTPHYGNVARTADLLQREMLSVVFGWNDTARALVRDELLRHRAGSASAVLLSKWLGDVGADNMASMIGSESMSSSDWMLLALSSIGGDSQKKVGEAFVQRLLEKGDVHPAVAILLGLGENNDAIEVYVSQGNWLEAVLITCLTCPADWGRISYLLRKWGEIAVQQGQAELAVRCFSVTSVETSEPWFSPRAQDAVYAAQQERLTQPLSAEALSSPPLSPPSRSGSGRLAMKNASLKLITTFGDKGAPVDSMASQHRTAAGITPIAQSALPQSALSPGAGEHWHSNTHGLRDPSSARTATPGGFGRRKRLPSRGDIERAKQEAANLATPITATVADTGRPSSSVGSRRGATPEPTTAMKATAYEAGKLAPFISKQDVDHLPSPQAGVFNRLQQASTHKRTTSRDRKPDGLAVQIAETQYLADPSPALTTSSTRSASSVSRTGTLSPSQVSARSGKAKAIDQYISSVEEAREMVREATREKRARSKRRAESRQRGDGSRAASRNRDVSETRGRGNVHYIRPAKRSPSSPVPMSPEEIAMANQARDVEPATTDDESFYKVTSPKSPAESRASLQSGRSGQQIERPLRSPEDRLKTGAQSSRGRSQSRKTGSMERSPSAPLPVGSLAQGGAEDDTTSDGHRIRLRANSRADRDQQPQTGLAQSSSTDSMPDDAGQINLSDSKDFATGTALPISSYTSFVGVKPRTMSKKDLAAKELEERRLSLARRPSAPAIPMPGDSTVSQRPTIGMRSHTDLSNSPTTLMPAIYRSQTVDPEAMSRYGRIPGTSTTPAPIGLPATPRAMRHPKYMGSEISEPAPPVPEVPINASELSSIGTGSSLSQYPHSTLTSNASHVGPIYGSTLTSMLSTDPYKKAPESDDVAPLLPSTTFGQAFKDVRSASAPPQELAGVHPAYKSSLPPSSRRQSITRGHVRKISPPDAPQVSAASSNHASIDETLLAGPRDDQIVFIPEPESEPPMLLPELQHLAGPPPPPPAPTMYSQQPANNSGVINIAIDENAPTSATDVPLTLPSTTYPQPMERAQTTSPSLHRRGRGSVSETFGSRFRGFGDRMRSTSRNRTKSPHVDGGYKPSPYESVLPPMPAQPPHQRKNSISRAKSPYEQAMAMQAAGGANQDQIPPPPPPPPAPGAGMDVKLQETTIPPSTLPPARTQSAAGGYRNPKEIRANMPPGALQQGVQGGFL